MSRPTHGRTTLLLIVCFALLLVAVGGASLASAQSPALAPPAQEDVIAEAAVPLGSEFTYQGQLRDSAGPVNDTCAFAFSLWDALEGGSQVGGVSTALGVQVVGGYFTATVNGAGQFGATAFTGQARWLQISVDCGEGTELLAPRQPLSAAPYAQYGEKAGNADLLDGQHASAFVRTAGPSSVSGNNASAIFSVTQTGSGPAASFSAAGNNYGVYATSEATSNVYSAVKGVGGYSGVWGLAGGADTFGVIGINGGAGTGGYFRAGPGGLALHVDGSARVDTEVVTPKVRYSPAKVDYYTITGEAFTPGSNRDYYNSGGMGGANLVSGNGMMTAPLHLPHGAIVTGFTFHYYDNSTSSLSATLERMPLPTGSYAAMASVNTPGPVGTVYASLSDTTVDYPQVDNLNYGYLIYVWSSAWDANNLRIMGATVTYTLSEAH